MEPEHRQRGAVLVARLAVVARAQPLREPERPQRLDDPLGDLVVAHDHVGGHGRGDDQRQGQDRGDLPPDVPQAQAERHDHQRELAGLGQRDRAERADP